MQLAVSHTDQEADDLVSLARDVVRAVRPNRRDREEPDDCFQEAFVVGLQTIRAAHQANHRCSRHVLFLKMRDHLYRLLHRPRFIREADLSNTTQSFAQAG